MMRVSRCPRSPMRTPIASPERRREGPGVVVVPGRRGARGRARHQAARRGAEEDVTDAAGEISLAVRQGAFTRDLAQERSIVQARAVRRALSGYALVVRTHATRGRG